MTPDHALVGGLIILALAIPSALSAFIDGRAPRLGAALIVIGGVSVVWAITNRPGGYPLSDVPTAFIRVLADVVN